MSDAEDQRLIETYRAAGGELPPPALDRAILESAREAVAAQQRTQPAALYRSRWLRPLALAASVVLGLGIVIRVQMERPDLTPPVAQNEQAAPAGAAAPAAQAPVAAQAAPTQDAAVPAPELPITKTVPVPVKRKEAVQNYAGKAAKLDQAPSLSQPGAAVEESKKREAGQEAAAGTPGAPGDSAQRARLQGSGSNIGFRGTDETAVPQTVDKAARRDDNPVAAALGGNLSKDSARAEAQARSAPATTAGLTQQAAPPEMTPPPAASAPAAPASIVAAPPPPPPAMPAPSAGPRVTAPAKPIAPAQQPEPADAKVADSTTAASAATRDGAAKSTFRTSSTNSIRPLDESNPDSWAKRIGELRRAGRGLDADAELKRLRARYPDFKMPAEALPPPPASASPAPQP